MNNLLKMERYQLVHNRVYWGGILGVFLLGFITADTYVPEVMGPSGGAAQSLVDIFNGMVYDSTFLLILICSILSLILGQEFTWRTISQEICVGHTRQQIFASKIISYLAAFNIMAIVYPVAGCIREYKAAAILTPITVTFEVILEVIIPMLMAVLIDRGINRGSLPDILKTGALLVGCCVVSLLCGALSGGFCAKAGAGFAKNLRHDMFYRVQDYSFANIDKFSASSIITRMTTDVTNVQNSN